MDNPLVAISAGIKAQYNLGCSLVRQATEKEGQGQLKEALQLYTQGIQELLNALNEVKKREKALAKSWPPEDIKALRTKIVEYLTRAEEIKKIVSEQTVH